MTRLETAEKFASIIEGKVWSPKGEDGKIRVYAAKRGYAEITEKGINIDAINGHQFDDAKAAADEIGVKYYRG